MIRTRALRFAYPSGATLSFHDLDAPQGAIVLLRGNSGAGKSTWLALAAGLLTATSGEVVVAQQSLSALSRSARDAWRGRTVGFLPQKLHLSGALTVERNLQLPFFATGLPVDRPAVNRSLDTLGLAGLADRFPSQLSVGQAQRVALARATLMQPKVILADEPTASLDDEAAAASLALLADTARHCGATLVIATHDRRVPDALPGAIVHSLGPGASS
ncbi:MAG: ATP-binding cassette domain-containing protein [Ramlibacter sp.]|nr:ATP-binding cassette domain-containing protein [Ramlibacter sp.]